MFTQASVEKCKCDFSALLCGNLFFLNRLVWIDAHPDINTPDSSTTGNCHGMPVAYLLSLVEWFRMPEPRLKPHEVVYIGLVRGKKYEKNIQKSTRICFLKKTRKC